jgi:hypothetical protein
VIDVRGQDLNNVDINYLHRFRWYFHSSKRVDVLASKYGSLWYKRIDIEKVRERLVGKRVIHEDEFGVIYNVFIDEQARPHPVLLVSYNINGGGYGARIVEFIDCQFPEECGDVSLLSSSP